ncbi:hypothetical protein [Chitinophaga sedimenti]|nr:hypothetical protein [Chitinophaga sedimenti]
MTATSSQIEASHLEAITYQPGELMFTVLGGIRLEGFTGFR